MEVNFHREEEVHSTQTWRPASVGLDLGCDFGPWARTILISFYT